MDAAGYAEALRERLPDYDVAHARTPAEERRLLARAPVATGFTLDPTALADSALEYFACSYAGTGHLPMNDLAANGVAVTNASGVHGPNISEYVLGAILSFARRFHRAFRQGERGQWRSFGTHELAGSTVTVVGLGAIGKAVVERLDAFDVHTVGVRYTPEKGGPTDELYGFDGIHEAVTDADYVAIAAPLTDETRGLFDADTFLTMDPEAVLVNVGRGPIVETDALVSTLRSNGIRGAALDVTDPEPLPGDHPLWGFDNVLLTPHNAGHTPRYWDRLADIVADNVHTAAETGAYDDLRNQVE